MEGVWTRRRVIGGVIALVVVTALGALVVSRANRQGVAAAPGAHATPAMEFTAADLVYASARPMSRFLPVSGTLQPLNQVVVKAKVSGELKEIAVREGDTVRAGQVIARFDTADLDAKLAERIGALESSRAQLALATKTRAMNVKLLDQKFISQNAFDSSESGFDVASGNVKSAEAQVKMAQIALRDGTVQAPQSGMVAKRHVQPGEKVPFDAPLVTIVDLSNLEMQAMVPASDVPELKVGMTVDLGVNGFGERRFAGRIDRINPSTEPGTRAILVYVTLRNPDTLLRGGMFADGRIALAASAPVTTLPMTAVRNEAGLTYVWAIAGGKLAKRVVVVGRRDDDNGLIELKSALPPDLPVLAARFDNLKEGASVLVRSTLAPSASRPG
ncbi:MAG TPA: efflux RND transporter periplasmic adaptor subunit [Casimicrobiaceae bacterium]|jgi:RND family efflux transporter MFP subunit|nr:efflux RND transporter periplasmic adaptor subunit [Casimicrobiaceae bacterium]